MSAHLIAKETDYRLLPFRFLRLDDERQDGMLLTAETGEYLFASEVQLKQLVGKQLDRKSKLYRDLLARHFIYEPGVHDPLPEMAAQYRSRKAFLWHEAPPLT